MSPNLKLKQQKRQHQEELKQKRFEAQEEDQSSRNKLNNSVAPVGQQPAESIRKLQQLQTEVEQLERRENPLNSATKEIKECELNNNSNTFRLTPVALPQYPSLSGETLLFKTRNLFDSTLMMDASNRSGGNSKSTRETNGSSKSSSSLQRAISANSDTTTLPIGSVESTPASDRNLKPVTNPQSEQQARSRLVESPPLASAREPAITPSYSSIFNTSHYQLRNNAKQPPNAKTSAISDTNQLKTTERNQLKKQAIVDEQAFLETAIGSDGFDGTRSDTNESGPDEDNDVNESFPLSDSGSKLKNFSTSSTLGKRPPAKKNPSPTGSNHQRCSSPSAGSKQYRHQYQQHHHHHNQLQQQHKPSLNYNVAHKCYANECVAEHQNHTKISFNNSRPPSFSSYPHQHGHETLPGKARQLNANSDWQRHSNSSSTSSCCDCNLNRFIRMKHNSGSMDSEYCLQKYKCSRTESMHQILKSIILILLTLLLLMIFTGIIMASHYLPQVFDKLLSATRSFNVTIAG